MTARGRMVAVLAVALALGAALPAAASEDFDRMQFNWTMQDLRAVATRHNDLTDRIGVERDFTRGCKLLAEAIENLKNGQILADKAGGFANRIGDVDGFNATASIHNEMLEYRHSKEADFARLCANR